MTYAEPYICRTQKDDYDATNCLTLSREMTATNHYLHTYSVLYIRYNDDDYGGLCHTYCGVNTHEEKWRVITRERESSKRDSTKGASCLSVSRGKFNNKVSRYLLKASSTC